MLAPELFEDIRSLLREPQRNAGVTDPQTYTDDTLVGQVRSAFRHLKARGVVTDAVIAEDGTLTGTLDDTVGVLVSLRVASTLLRGDLIQRVVSGSMGMVFRMGNDLIDTKTAAISFKEIAKGYDDEFTTMLTLALSVEGEVYGGPNAPGR